MRIKALFFDLDDTLLRDDLSISGFTLSVLRTCAERGIAVIPASGRTRESMLPFVEELGCAAMYVACNGAEIYSAGHSLLRQVRFPFETAEAIVAFADENGCYAQTYADSHFYYSRENGWVEKYAATSRLTGVHQPDLTAFIRAHPTAKILMMHQPEVISALLAPARERFRQTASVTCSKPYFMEFNPPEATKGRALHWCGDRLGFTAEEAAAFGDSLNDLSMLETAGVGVCVANAQPAVLAAIPRRCLSNQEDGLARYVKEHLLTDEPGTGGAHD